MNASDLIALAGVSPAHAELYLLRSQRNFLSMRPWLPARCGAFLDIGCGLGRVAALVAEHYPDCAAHLLDGAVRTKKWVGWRENGAAWADVHVAARLFAQSHPHRRPVAWTPELVAAKGFGGARFDLVFSNCSWGHHYPIGAYLAAVIESMCPGATLIIDLRRGSIGDEGAGLLAEHFDLVDGEAHLGKKYRRTAWTRK